MTVDELVAKKKKLESDMEILIRDFLRESEVTSLSFDIQVGGEKRKVPSPFIPGEYVVIRDKVKVSATIGL